jgi:hypothetical protein
VLEESIVCAGLAGEEVRDGLRFAIGGREQVFCGEFVFAEIFFDAERSDLHEASVT